MTTKAVGGHRWGTLTGGRLPCGGTHYYRLVVFPPGTSAREGIWLRAWLYWPVAGTVLTVVLTLVLADGPLPVPIGLLLTLALVVCGHLGLRHAVRRQRPGMRVVHVEYLRSIGTRAELEMSQLVAAVGRILSRAELAAQRGELTPVDFELLWGSLHARVGALAESTGSSSQGSGG